MCPLVRVPFTGAVKQLELVVVQIEYAAPKFNREFSGPRPMLGIIEFVLPP
jgi:hypothetical protein